MTKVIKGRAVAEFLALNAVEGEEQQNLKFPDENLALIKCHEWKLYFNGAVNNRGAGLGVILMMPEGETIPMAKKLDFKVTNNMAEYEQKQLQQLEPRIYQCMEIFCQLSVKLMKNGK